jgi:hypothetical protein
MSTHTAGCPKEANKMLSNLWNGFCYSPDDKGGGGNGDDDKADDKDKSQDKDKGKALAWKPWHDALPKEAQELIATRESGLKTALDTERDARKTAETDLRSVAKKLEKGSEAQKEVLKLADTVAEGNRKSDFYEDAHKAGVSNLKLAFIVATDEGLFDKRGNANFDKLKEGFPELFGKKRVVDPNAGDGTDTLPDGQKKDMNAFIRASRQK